MDLTKIEEAHVGKPIIVGITGKRGHGKSTAAQALERRGFRHINFADPIKEVAELIYGIPMAVLQDPVLKETVLDTFPFVSPRDIMQKIGTDFFRKGIHEDTWIEMLKRRAGAYSHVVISDVRFPNEADMIRSMGGIILKVVDPKKMHTDAASQHASETEIDKIVPDWTIENTGTIADLQAAVEDIVL